MMEFTYCDLLSNSIISYLNTIMIRPHTIPHRLPVTTDNLTYSLASLILFAPIMFPTKTENAIERAIGIT